MDNFEIFKQFLDADEIRYSEDSFDDGDKILIIPQKIKNGGLVNILVIFGEHKIKVAVPAIVTIEDEDKQLECYKLFNDFNMQYAFFKMYIRPDGNVCAEGDFSLEVVSGQLDPKELMSFVMAAIFFVGKVYPDIMRIQWT